MSDQPNAKAHRPVPTLDQFPHRIGDIIRFADLDPNGHVNNAVFSTYFESGRVSIFRTPDLGTGVAGVNYILARTEIDFLRELRWPGTVEVGTAIADFGRTSFRVTQAIFHDGQCAAIGLAVMVCIEQETRRSIPLPEAMLARLRPWMLRTGEK